MTAEEKRIRVLVVLGLVALVLMMGASFLSGWLASRRSETALRTAMDKVEMRLEFADYSLCLDRQTRTRKANLATAANRANWLIAAAARQADHDLGVAEAYRENAKQYTQSAEPHCSDPRVGP